MIPGMSLGQHPKDTKEKEQMNAGAFIKKSACLTGFPECSRLAFVCSIQQGSENQRALFGRNIMQATHRNLVSKSHFDKGNVKGKGNG